LKPTKLYRAVKPWTPIHPDPLTLKKGDIVWVQREDNEYIGFAWCDFRGRSGWVPFDKIGLIDDVRGTMKADYTSRELTLCLGDEVRGSTIVSGWLWAERVGTGEEGWVPLNSLKEINSDKVQQ
jgi:hypothetical protein